MFVFVFLFLFLFVATAVIWTLSWVWGGVWLHGRPAVQGLVSGAYVFCIYLQGSGE